MVLFETVVIGVGAGKSKREAKSAAAENALQAAEAFFDMNWRLVIMWAVLLAGAKC